LGDALVVGLLLGKSAAHEAWDVVLVGVEAHFDGRGRKLKIRELVTDEMW
tara:strand:+ start:337 stop:486 length:150 start_codon:yes stop_codon:yes gene_type:complete